MADDLPQVDDLGRSYDETISPTPKPVGNVGAVEDTNFFSQFVTGGEKPYQDMGFGQRFSDTAKANFYTGTFLGTGIAANQADPAGRSRALNEGLSPEEQDFNNKIIADWEAKDIASRKGLENDARVTDAQVAVIQNKLHPSVGGVGDAAADITGALAGGMASPEMWVLPSFRAAEGIAAAAPVTAKFLEGMAGRMVNTGVSMAVLNTATNPVIQKQSETAGLQPDFDPMRLALAPLEGFIGGAVLHGGMEAIGKGVGYFGSQVRKGFDQRIWDHVTNPLKDDPAFLAPGERPPMVEPEKIGEPPRMATEAPVGQPVTGRPAPAQQPAVQPASVGTTTPQARLAEQPTLGPQSVTARMSADKIKSDLGVDIPGILIHSGPFGTPEVPGVTAWHGSPHDFEKFDISKIGTGEGAQAYGHGLYFAESEPVAKGYRDRLAQYPITRDSDEWGLAQAFLKKANGDPNEALRLYTEINGSGHPEAEKVAHYIANPNVSQGSMYQVRINADPAHFLDWDKPLSEQPPKVKSALERLGVDVSQQEPGQTGYLDIAESRAKPQAQDNGSAPNGWGSIQNTFNDRIGSHSRASQALAREGVKGIAYFDNGSRASGQLLPGKIAALENAKEHLASIDRSIASQGNSPTFEQVRASAEKRLKEIEADVAKEKASITRNFVVFDHNDVQIIGKNGKPVPINDHMRTEAQAKFADELKAAGVKPEQIDADLAKRAEASGNTDIAAAHEDAALAREYETPGGRALVRTHYGKFKVKEPPKESAPSLITFLAKNGGVKPNADLDAIFGRGTNHQKGKGRLINKSGQTLDDALKAAAEAGYLRGDHQSLTVADLLDAIQEDAAGRKVYPEGMDKESIASRQAYERQTAELDAAEKHVRDQVKMQDDAEPLPDQVWRDAAAHMVFGGEENPHVAFDRAVLDYEREQGHALHGGTASEHGEGAGRSRLERAGYDEEGRLVGPRDEFPGFESTGGEPGSREATGTAGAGRTEAGADGKPQQLIPGVEPVTDRQRAELAASKPLKGGEAPAGGMFDEANTAQSDLQFRTRDPNAPSGVAGIGQAGTASGGAAPEIVHSLQQQSFALAETLGIPLRQGRLQGGKEVVGQFSKYGVARVREVADFLTVAHEGGHGLEQKIGPELTGLIQRHAAELGPLDYDQTLQRPAEGFAEWFATSLTNPAAAQQKAPGFTAAFRTFMGQHDPALIDALDKAASDFAAYLNAPSGVRVASQVVQKGETGWFHETADYLKKEGFPATIGKVLADAYTAFFDDKAPVARTVRNLARLFRDNNGGQLLDLKAADNPETLLRLFGRAQQGAIYQMRYGVVPYRDVTPQGASLHDAIATATGASPILGRWRGSAVDDFSTYLVAKRAAVLWDRFNAGDLEHPPVGFSKADALETMRVLSEANAGFEQGSQMVHDYTRNMLTKQRDAGLISQELYDKLASDPFYVPLFRDVEDKPLAGKSAGGRSPDGPGMTDTIKRLRGSSRDIIDPIQGIMMQTFLAERTIRHNDIIRAFADLADRVGAGSGAFVEKVPAKELSGTPFDLADQIKSVARQRGLDPNDTALLMNSVTNAFGDDPIMGTMFKMQPAAKRGEPILFYKEAGELKAVRFQGGKEGDAAYDVLAALPNPLKDLTLQVMQGAASTLRFGVTANPVFIATNFIRDQMALGVLRPDYVPFVSGMRGLKSELTQDKAAQLYAYFGGVSPGASVTDTRGMMDANIGSIAVKGYGAARLNLSSPKEFAHGVVEAMQVTEAASRNSVFAKVYEQKMVQGLTPYEAAIEAAYQGTDILDFGRHGSRTMALRQLVPFLNAHLQGLDLGRRTILEPLARAARGEVLTTKEQAQVKNAYLSMTKFAGLGSALGFAYASLAWDREEYRDANNDMKATHLIIPWGHKVITIPKPFELSLGFNAGEAAYAALVGKDPRAAANFTEGAWEVLKPPNPITGNPLIKTTFEVALNRNLFTGRDIVPDSLKAIDPQHQFTERTSMFARKVGDITNSLSDFLKDHTNNSVATLMGLGDAWSPIKVDYAIGSLFGMWGKDIQAASNWFAGDDDKPESQFEDMVFLRRFLKDPNRSGEMTKRYFEFAAQKTGQYAQAVNTFDRYTNMYQDQKAQDWFATLNDDKKAFVTLNAGADDEGTRKFSADDLRLHPVTRAQNAMQSLNSITRELTFNSQINTETGERYNLTPVQRRDAIEALHQLGAQEMRNALVMVGDKGYEGRSVMDTGLQYEVIKAISPEIAAEVSRRYATAKVLPAASIAEVWPQAKKRLVQEGSDADISDLTSDAQAAGFEFGGERTKRREKRRQSIKGQRETETVQ